MRAASAANAAIVEVDRDTGVVSIEKCSWSSTDCGRIINPLLADAQIAGGVMQGLGGTLCEEMVHDPDGQVLSGSFMDYTGRAPTRRRRSCPTISKTPRHAIRSA